MASIVKIFQFDAVTRERKEMRTILSVVVLVLLGAVEAFNVPSSHFPANAAITNRAAAPVALVPLPRAAPVAVPVALGVVSMIGWMRAVIRGEGKALRFSNMRWYEVQDEVEGAACVVLGEEEEPNG